MAWSRSWYEPMRKEVKERILNQNTLAETQAALVTAHPEYTREQVIECVRKYICHKFYLDPSESLGLSLTQMADRSIERMIELKMPIAKESEKATTCGMAGSAAMKIALLFLALRKDFCANIPLQRLAYVNQSTEIGALVYETRQKKAE